MEFLALPTLALPWLVHDALIVVGAAAALLAILAFINIGVLLPGLLSSLGRYQPDQRGAYLEFGPAAAPLISEPAPWSPALETSPEPHAAVRLRLWSHLSGGGCPQPLVPSDGGTR